MLEYENQMFLEVLQEDGLVIAAKGLGLDTVFMNIMKVYSDPGNLVIVLGTTDYDEQYFIEKLRSVGLKFLPRIITAQFPSNERELMYLEGGVLFVSGRILVVDLLKKRLPIHLVTGMLVYRAHTILNACQEAFALRLYRQNNKTGFIKAFTNSALAFTIGFAQVERVMKTLFVKNLYLWPRFHVTVSSSLSKHKIVVTELHVKLTPKMLKIQSSLLDIMNYIVKELKNTNKYLDLDEITTENAMAKKFHKQLQLQLDPIWHQLSFRTKQLIADLKTLRSLLICLTHEDSVSFYEKFYRLRTTDYAMNSSGWLLLDTVENLVAYARDRVYDNKKELKPEPCPKWSALSEILREIQDNIVKQKTDEKVDTVLILVQDRNTCDQVKKYLTMGATKYLSLKAEKLQSLNKTSKDNLSKNDGIESKDTDNEEETKESYVLSLSQKPSGTNQSDVVEGEPLCQDYFDDCSELADIDLTAIGTPNLPIVIVQSLKKHGDPMALQRILSEKVPRYIVMYAADISAVRQLEAYQNNNPSIQLNVYFLIYGGSVEEQAYLTSLRREKEAFDMLINTKTTMVVPADQDGKSDECLALIRESGSAFEDAENTRKGGIQGDNTKVEERVIVDMREFRSELPALLHKRGIEIEPVQLLIGDYILSPEICVERKSISDLIGSLNSGRLYNQAVAMTRHYTKPMLLIEFDPNKPFCFQGHYYISKDMKNTDITVKLQLLTLHFPRLKLVWSPSPHATAQLFEELKQGREQPDGNKAAQIGMDENTEDKEIMVEKYNSHVQDFLAKLPGVHSKNLRVILNKGKSLDHLVNLTMEELTDMLSNTNDAKLLYNALHDKFLPVKDAGVQNPRESSKRGRGIFRKRKQ
ncbi:DNA repair endonuclease XPF isoform X1 [Cephus cinctus]|nr:DNA repair endonuclease XPF isoform X1 [Cephus cinctus]XP_024942377.1 DNA repair endonuclease XPF isoform X1 [Cephus cinctus]